MCRAALLIWAAVSAFPAVAQITNAVPMPQPEIQYLDASGQPLVGGKLCTYVANTTTALATFTDSTAGTANSNPVVLDATGRASVWISPYQLYKFVLRTGGDGTCTTGTIQWTQDNVGISGPGNINALYVVESGSGAGGRGGYIDLAPVTYPTSSCFDAYGNPSNIPLQQAGYPAFGANDAILWVSESPLPGVSPPACVSSFTPNQLYGLNTNTYIWAMAGFASQLSAYNTFDAAPCGNDASCALGPTGQQGGGMHALSFTANNYVNLGQYSGPLLSGPPLTTSDSFNPGAVSYSTAAGCFAGYNGTFWTCLSGGGGGGGLPTGPQYAVQINNPAGTFYGDANLTYTPTGTPQLTLAGIYSADGAAGVGFNVPTSAATNAIQAVNGGVTSKWHIASDSVFWLQEVAPSISASGQCRTYMDSTSHDLQLSCNGGAYSAIASGAVTSVFTRTGAVAATSGDYTAALVTNAFDTSASNSIGAHYVDVTDISAPAAPTAGHTRFYTNGGLLCSENPSAVSACVGGAGTVSSVFGQTGVVNIPVTTTDIATPAAPSAGTTKWYTKGGALCAESPAAVETCTGGAGGGVSSITVSATVLTGALTFTGTANQVILTPSGSTLNFSLPQSIATTSAVTFGTVTTGGTNGPFNSGSTGSNISFQNTNANFQVSGAGNVSIAGVYTAIGGVSVISNVSFNSIQTSGGINIGNTGSSSGAYQINGYTVVNPSHDMFPNNVTTAGTLSLGQTVSSFNGLGTVGMGVAPVYWNSTGSISGNVSNSILTQSSANPPSGRYRVCADGRYISGTGVGTSYIVYSVAYTDQSSVGQVQYLMAVNDGSGAPSINGAPVGTTVSSCTLVQTNGSAMTFQTGITGTIQTRYDATLERLN